MKFTFLKIVFTSVFLFLTFQSKAQFLGGDEDGHAHVRLTNSACIAINANPFLGGEGSGHGNQRQTTIVCTTVNANPFLGGGADGHANERLTTIVCPVVNANPFTGGEADGHANERLTTIICPVINANPFLGGEADGHSNERVVNNPLCIPLPIELLSFTAKPIDKIVQLDWSTLSETNNDYFAVERSKDAMMFEKVETIKGAGNSAAIVTYQTIDQNPYWGTSFYRLKQTDFNGQSEYSKIVSVIFNDENTSKVNVYPIPFDNELIVELISDFIHTTTFELTNAIGVTLLSGRFSQKTILPTSPLASGIYVLKIDFEDYVEYFKVIKK